MTHESTQPDPHGGVLDRAIARLTAEIVDGLRHGYFDFRLDCELASHERRQLVLHAGKSYRFSIPKDECISRQNETTLTMGASASTDEPRRIAEMTSLRQTQTESPGLEPLVAHAELG